MSDVLENLRLAIEGLPVDLRKAMRPTLNGVVVKVYDSQNADDTDEYYKVDIQVDGTDTDPGVLIPYVRVNSLWAQDGYGVFALPEVGAKVKVGFTNADTHLPFVDLSYWDGDNEAPRGFQAGSFAIRGKQGQKVEIKAGTNEIVLSAESIKNISAVKQEQVVGDQKFAFHGNRSTIIDGAELSDMDRLDLKIWRDATIEIGQVGRTDQPGRTSSGANLNLKILGNETHSAGGSFSLTSGGGMAISSAAGMSMSSIFSRNDMVGGKYSMICLGGSGNPATPAYSVFAPLGIQLTSSLLGGLGIPGAVIIGSTTIPGAETILLGGAQALTPPQPAPHGPGLIAFLTLLIQALMKPIGIGNLGAPIIPSPLLIAELTTLLTKVVTPATPDGASGGIVSTKVYTAAV